LTLLQPQEKSQLYEIKAGNRISLIKINLPKTDLQKEISFENLGPVIFKKEYNKLSCVKGLEQITLK
ncbi:MAG: hypothetical protein SPK02_08220, partial [Succinivibrio sp.]|nr:hypothetical protein [Succinivibrio sp.]